MWNVGKQYEANFGPKGVTLQEDIYQKSTRIFVSFYTDLSTVIVEQMNSILDND